MSDRPNPISNRRSILSFFARAGFLLSVLAVLTAMTAGGGTRWGWWRFMTGFTLLKWGAYGAVAGLILSVVGLVGALRGSRRGGLQAFLGSLLSLALLANGAGWLWTAKSVPPIHDITTDTENPPHFIAILKAREGAPNSADYGGPAIAAQQKAGYPDLGPATLPIPPDAAFKKALDAAGEMGWEIVDANPAEGRIEATDTTFWFGFKDDIVVRVAPSGSGSRVDVRSVSRVGRSDVGTNARRIQKFLKKLSER